MADLQTELSQSGTTLYLRPADGFQRSTQFGEAYTNSHHFTGSVFVSGVLYANEYKVNQIDTLSGSTIFGNDATDTHQFTGSVQVSADANLAGNLYLLDDKKLYLGNNRDVSLEYDEDGTDRFIISALHSTIDNSAGGSLRITGSTEISGATFIQGAARIGNQGSQIHQVTGSTHFGGLSGITQFNSDVHVNDDKKIIFGAGSDASIEYDENGTDKLIISGSTLFEGENIFGNQNSYLHKFTGSVGVNGTLAVGTNVILTSTGMSPSVSFINGVTQIGATAITATNIASGSMAGPASLIGLNAGNQLILTASAIAAATNGLDNRVATFGSYNTLNGEANLTFDGSTLATVGAISGSSTVTAHGNLSTNAGKFTTTGGGAAVSAVLSGTLVIQDESGVYFGAIGNRIISDSGESTHPLNIVSTGLQINANTRMSGTVIVSSKANAVPKVAFEVHYTGTNNPVGLSNDTGGGEVVYFGTGSTSAGFLYYLNKHGGWEKANATAAGTYGTAGAGNESMIAIAIGSNPKDNGMLIKGWFDADAGFTGTYTAGKAVYIYADGSGGKMSATAPAASSNFVRIVGYATDTSKVIWFNPDSTWVVVD